MVVITIYRKGCEMDIKNIYNFHCPRWDEIPEEDMFNKEVVSFINSSLSDILNEEDYLTTTMVQNYLKWEIIDRPLGRKYNRSHVAKLIVITILNKFLVLKM